MGLVWLISLLIDCVNELFYRKIVVKLCPVPNDVEHYIRVCKQLAIVVTLSYNRKNENQKIKFTKDIRNFFTHQNEVKVFAKVIENRSSPTLTRTSSISS